MTVRSAKAATRLFHAGRATYRRVSTEKWGGPYGQTHIWAKWRCLTCGKRQIGTDEAPDVRHFYTSEWTTTCARNGHAPCRLCGVMLPCLDCGCRREHNWRICPAKTELDRIKGQHGKAGHEVRP